MKTWQLQDAKARLSEVIDSAVKSGPQFITRRGIKMAVIIPIEQWERLTELRLTSAPSEPELPKANLTNAEFLKLLQSAPDFDIPDRHDERLKERRHRSV